jgi:hypothetical protein
MTHSRLLKSILNIQTANTPWYTERGFTVTYFFDSMAFFNSIKIYLSAIYLRAI